MGHVLGRLIAFDLDGTLIDSSRDLADSVNELLVELGAAPLPLDAVTKMVGEGAKVLVRRALAASVSRRPPQRSNDSSPSTTPSCSITRVPMKGLAMSSGPRANMRAWPC
jgi:hypothetical protein